MRYFEKTETSIVGLVRVVEFEPTLDALNALSNRAATEVRPLAAFAVLESYTQALSKATAAGLSLGCVGDIRLCLMETTVPLWVTIVLALSSGLFGLLGALGGQLISARANFKLKKLELLYVRKAEAYRDLLVNAATFSYDPNDEEKYRTYLSSYFAALTVASGDVQEVLSGKTGVSVNAQRLRMNRDANDLVKIQTGSWYDAMKQATTAIQNDLLRLAKD